MAYVVGFTVVVIMIGFTVVGGKVGTTIVGAIVGATVGLAELRVSIAVRMRGKVPSLQN